MNTKIQQEKILLPVDHVKLFATLAVTEQTLSLTPALRQINLNRPKSTRYPAWPARDFRCYEWPSKRLVTDPSSKTSRIALAKSGAIESTVKLSNF